MQHKKTDAAPGAMKTARAAEKIKAAGAARTARTAGAPGTGAAGASESADAAGPAGAPDAAWRIAPAEPGDAREILAFLRAAGGESDNLTFGPEGLPVTAAQERAYLARLGADADRVLLAARVHGRIAALAGMSRGASARQRHRAQVDVCVRRDCWNRGLATRLLTELLDTGRRAGVTAFTLEVLADNAAAIHLYTKLGFRTVGRWERYFCMEDGTCRAALAMELCV